MHPCLVVGIRKQLLGNISGPVAGKGYVLYSQFILIPPFQSCKPNSNPSPDAYNPDAHPVSVKCIFGRDKRSPSYIIPPKTPGPDVYDLSVRPVRPRSPVYSLAARLPRQTRSLSPPPTAYDTDKKEYITPKWSFGKSNRTGIPCPTACTNPGPGRYNPVEEPTFRKAPVYTLKDRVRVSGQVCPNPDTPSPATYGGLYTQFA